MVSLQMGKLRDLVTARRAAQALLVLSLTASCSSPTTPTPPPPPPPVAEPPSLSCPAEGVSRATTNAGGLTVNYDTPSVTGGQGAVSVACTPLSGENLP